MARNPHVLSLWPCFKTHFQDWELRARSIAERWGGREGRPMLLLASLMLVCRAEISRKRCLGQVLEGICVSRIIKESNKEFPHWTLIFSSKKSRFLKTNYTKQRTLCSEEIGILPWPSWSIILSTKRLQPILIQGTCPGCGFQPWLGHVQEAAN